MPYPKNGRHLHLPPMTPKDAFLPALGIFSVWDSLALSAEGEERRLPTLVHQCVLLNFYFNRKWPVPEGITACDNADQEGSNLRKQMKDLESQEENWGCAKPSPWGPMSLPSLHVVRWEFSEPNSERWQATWTPLVQYEYQRIVVQRSRGYNKCKFEFCKSFRNVLNFRDVKSGAKLVQKESAKNAPSGVS